jgi:hypothetical protein
MGEAARALEGISIGRYFIRIKLEEGLFVIDLRRMAHDERLAVSRQRWDR